MAVPVRSVWQVGPQASRRSAVSTERPSWAPVGVDMEVPSPARMYDALLGGSHNFDIDRKAAAMATSLVPDLPKVALS
ncbi:MAG: SAM-dependent methyltransferase, partial [Pseudonocardiaceae bacterium]